MEKKEYLRPMIKVCDYISRNGYCMEIDPGVSTEGQLGKEAQMDFNEDDAATEQLPIQRSVWDE